MVTDPDTAELEVANLLLQLGTDSEKAVSDNAELAELDMDINNEELLPLNAPPLEDFTKKLAEAENPNALTEDNVESDSNDSEKTVDYVHEDNENNNNSSDKTVDHTGQQTEEVSSPKGKVNIKHYGIRRQSPQTKTAYFR